MKMEFPGTTARARALALLTAISFGAAGAVAHADGQPTISPASQTVAQWLSGSFDSSKQAAQDPGYFNVSLSSCAVAILDDSGSPLVDAAHIYVEQAIAGQEAAPYRQRVYRVSDSQNAMGAVESEILLILESKKYTGLCSLPEAQRVIKRSVIEDRGCSVFLNIETVSGGISRATGSTPSGGCPSSFNGATSVESTVTLNEDSLIAWDIGRDAAGQQVWGPEKGPYIFLRR
jgi:hypothetical protein